MLFQIATLDGEHLCSYASSAEHGINFQYEGERTMIKAELTLPEIGLIAATRGMLGAGIALLLADKLSAEQRKAVGWTLVGVGALTTIPLALEIFSSASRVSNSRDLGVSIRAEAHE
jgi:hypothetical protein